MSHNREHALRAWCASRLPGNNLEFEPVSSDASFRRYFRVRANRQSRIVMDAPPEHEDIRPFIDVAGRLAAARVHVPEILDADTEQGFVLLSDLGDVSYLAALNSESAPALFEDAQTALASIQAGADATALPHYDHALLQRELDLFTDWFLTRHWRIQPTVHELDAWQTICQILIQRAMAQGQVFVHRDYMPRNLMVTHPNPGIIDFQDAVLGPVSYDPVCLFRDAFISWPTNQVDDWLEDYRQRALATGLPVPEEAAQWRTDCDLMGAQRHLKVIGIFARIRYRDGKPHYLEDVPRFFEYLNTAIARNRELAELGGLLDAWKKRGREQQCAR